MDTDFDDLSAIFDEGELALKKKPPTVSQVVANLHKEYSDPKNWNFDGIVGIQHGDFCIGFFACYKHVREAHCRRLVADPSALRADRYEEMSI